MTRPWHLEDFYSLDSDLTEQEWSELVKMMETSAFRKYMAQKAQESMSLAFQLGARADLLSTEGFQFAVKGQGNYQGRQDILSEFIQARNEYHANRGGLEEPESDEWES